MPDDPIAPVPPPDNEGIPFPSREPTEDATVDAGETPTEVAPLANPSTASFPAEEKPVAVIGRYKLLKELGKGGFGIVWQAEQTEPIRREVALKIIKPGMDSREIIARFEAERQALALMDHPNIAAVLDAGTTDRGLPYFVMELVKGVPITEYCDARKLGIRQRLALFIPVCQAVQHAHQKAILHRDLKPSNILVTEVDGKPVPKVIDFGIAKALGASQSALLNDGLTLTQEGMVVGTPQYMSPEQAGSLPDVDTRSDIYTLGVILFELLVGETPLGREQLPKRALNQILSQIRQGATKRPSSRLTPRTEAVQQIAAARSSDPKRLSAALRGDLDWIVLKALEKERERRYETANALAKDLRRCLDCEPVSAGPPSTGYRLKKLVQRNRLAFGAAFCVVLALVAGVVTSTWQAVRATRANRLSRERLVQAEKARDAAENLIADAIFGLRDKLIPIGKISVLDEMEKAAEDYYANLPPELASSTTQHHQVRLTINRALVAAARSDDDATEEAALSALGTARRLAAEHPDDMRFVDDQTSALKSLIILRSLQGAIDEAAAYGDEARRLADRWLEHEPKAVEPLLVKLTVSAQRMMAVGRQGGKLSAAWPTFIEMQTISDQIKALGFQSIETATVDAVGKFGRASVVAMTGNDKLTEDAYHEADAAFVQAIETFGEHPFTRQMMLAERGIAASDLFRFAKRTGNVELKKKAERLMFDLVREHEKLTELEPLRVEWWKGLALSYDGVISIIEEREGPAAALEWCEKAFAAGEKAASPHCDRFYIRKDRMSHRVALIKSLRKVKPKGWAERALKLAAEATEIDLAPLKHGPHEIDLVTRRDLGRLWWEIVMEIDQPERTSETLRQFRSLIAAEGRTIDAAGDKAKALRDSIEAAGKIADFLQQRGRTEEAAEFVKQRGEWEQDINTRFANDPTMLRDRLSNASDRSLKLLNDYRSAPSAQKPAVLSELENQVRESRALLEEKHARLSAYDYARFRGAVESAFGTALVEARRFADAEAPLRVAIEARREAAAQSQNPDDAAQKRWEAADPLLKLSFAVCQEGRIEEGRKLWREGAEAREKVARERASSARFSGSGNAWREFASVLDTPEVAADQITALEKSVELTREGLRLAKAKTDTPDGELNYSRTSLADALLTLGIRQRGTKHLAESEVTLREALAVSMEHVGAAPGADPDRTKQLSNIRYDLARTLIELGRTDEARAQAAAIAADVRIFEDKAGQAMPEFDDARRRIADLQERLGPEPRPQTAE